MNDRRTDGRSAPDGDGLRADPRDRPDQRDTPRRRGPLDRLNLADRLRRAEPLLDDDTPRPATEAEIPWPPHRRDERAPGFFAEPGAPAPDAPRAEAPEPLIAWPLRRTGPDDAAPRPTADRPAPDRAEPRIAPERPDPPATTRRAPARQPAEPLHDTRPAPRVAAERPRVAAPRPTVADAPPPPPQLAAEPEPPRRGFFAAAADTPMAAGPRASGSTDRTPKPRPAAQQPAEPPNDAEADRPEPRIAADWSRPSSAEAPPPPRQPAAEPEPPRRSFFAAAADTPKAAGPTASGSADRTPKPRPAAQRPVEPPNDAEADRPEPRTAADWSRPPSAEAPPPPRQPAAEPKPPRRGFFTAGDRDPAPRGGAERPADARRPVEPEDVPPAGPRLGGDRPAAKAPPPRQPARAPEPQRHESFAADPAADPAAERPRRHRPDLRASTDPEDPGPAGPRLGGAPDPAAARRPATGPEPHHGFFAAAGDGQRQREAERPTKPRLDDGPRLDGGPRLDDGPGLDDGPRLAADRPRGDGDGRPGRRAFDDGFTASPRERSGGGKGGGNGRRPPPGRGRGGRSSGGGRGLGFQLAKWALVAMIWVVIALGAVVAYYAWDLPDVSQVAALKRRPAITLVAADGSVFARYGDLQGSAVDARKLPPMVVDAVLAVEDRHFFEHFGIDPIGMIRAALVDLRAGHIVQGGSTLTQQLAKNLFLTPDRTFKRKIQEILLALWLEQRYSKDEILTAYLNRVYLGSGAYGIDAAARIYFNKPATQLNLHEAAVIAGLLKAPSHYSPLADLKAATQRADVVLDEMVAAGFITQQQAAAAKATPILPAGIPGTGGADRYFADWVVDQVNDYIGPDNQDLTVYTTFDPALERAAESEITRTLSGPGAAVHASQAALVAMADDGAVKAMVGGRDYRLSQFNRATQALRQPGSSFKPFIYLTAMQEGLKPDSAIDASPVDFKGWRPGNYEREFKNFHGSITLADALAYSVNTATVRLLDQVGIDKVRDLARTYGISTPLRRDLSLGLGTSEVTLMDMTGGYAGIANGGHPVFPYAITRIAGSTGAVLYQRNAQPTAAAVNPVADAELVQMMTGVISHGTGTAARIGWPAAGKTGTTQDSRDAWFLGFTADLVTGVWMGNDDDSPMKRVVGGGLPARLWHDFMTDAEAGKPPRSLPALAAIGLAPEGPGAPPGSRPQPQTVSSAGQTIAGGITNSISDLIARITGQPATVTQGRQNTNGH